MRAILTVFFVRLPALVGDIFVRLRPLSEVLAFAALILLGVHSAADLMDDLFFVAVDQCDHVLDVASRTMLEGLASLGVLDTDRAAAWADDVAMWIDIDRKEAASVALALLAELLLGLMLLRWCVTAQAEAPTPVETGEQKQTVTQRSLVELRRLAQLAPGALRGLSLVLAFALGAFGLGRWAAVRLSLMLASASLGSASLYARIGGVLLGGLALMTLLPLVLHRAKQRSRRIDPGASWKSSVLPLVVVVVLILAVISGGPRQALQALMAAFA